VDSASYARSVREDTAELASYVLSDKKDKRNASFLGRKTLSPSPRTPESSSQHAEPDAGDCPQVSDEIIAEVSEPSSLESNEGSSPGGRTSILSSMLKNSPPKTDDAPPPSAHSADAPGENRNQDYAKRPDSRSSQQSRHSMHHASEETPLLQPPPRFSRLPDSPELSDGDELSDVESQKSRPPSQYHRYGGITESFRDGIRRKSSLFNPKTWDRRVIWRSVVVEPASCLPAVIVGLLLNILDALSYGKRRRDHHNRAACLSRHTRHDFISPWEPDIFASGARWYFDFLREHYCVSVDLLYRQYIQGWHWVRAGEIFSKL
jgi:sulfate permease, SulP family